MIALTKVFALHWKQNMSLQSSETFFPNQTLWSNYWRNCMQHTKIKRNKEPETISNAKTAATKATPYKLLFQCKYHFILMMHFSLLCTESSAMHHRIVCYVHRDSSTLNFTQISAARHPCEAQTSWIHYLTHYSDQMHRESKKQETKLLPITSPNVNRFSKFLYWQTQC